MWRNSKMSLYKRRYKCTILYFCFDFSSRRMDEEAGLGLAATHLYRSQAATSSCLIFSLLSKAFSVLSKES